MIFHRRIEELVRYAFTGGICVLLNVLISMLLTEYVGLNYLVSLAICSVMVIVIGFLLNKHWTFRAFGSAWSEFRRYALATGTNVIVGLWMCAMLVQKLGIHYLWAIAIVGVVSAPITYIVHRAWTFGLKWVERN